MYVWYYGVVYILIIIYLYAMSLWLYDLGMSRPQIYTFHVSGPAVTTTLHPCARCTALQGELALKVSMPSTSSVWVLASSVHVQSGPRQEHWHWCSTAVITPRISFGTRMSVFVLDLIRIWVADGCLWQKKWRMVQRLCFCLSHLQKRLHLSHLRKKPLLCWHSARQSARLRRKGWPSKMMLLEMTPGFLGETGHLEPEHFRTSTYWLDWEQLVRLSRMMSQLLVKHFLRRFSIARAQRICGLAFSICQFFCGMGMAVIQRFCLPPIAEGRARSWTGSNWLKGRRLWSTSSSL